MFLSALLSNPKDKITIAAHKKLKEFDPGLAKEFKNLQANNQGYLKILISGSVEPIETKIYHALVETIENYEFSKLLKKDLKKSDPSSSDVLALLKTLQDHLSKNTKFSGILLTLFYGCKGNQKESSII